MAVTGALLVGFLLAHMIGNLKIFFGASSFDSYAHWLREIGSPVLPHESFLWIQRIVLLAAIVLHIWAATALTIAARRARPIGYAHRKPIQGSYAARTMRWGGVIIALFVVYHLLDLTTRDLNPVADANAAYAAVTSDFAPARWYVTAFYTLAVVTLGFHLRHGIWSAFQTLGLRFSRAAALGISLLICVGFLVVPFAVTIGILK
ncbi:MAG TPA: succinate dehydrogenase [Micromonosporaceae bacterium]|nr:succinate dehydrogenase [Micromonosporaceae bacterium]